MKKRNMLFVAALFVMISARAVEYKGCVFIDKNKNGICDSGEKGLADVSVTDGLNVVKTDKKGMFSLPGHQKARFIYITSPSGYMSPSKHYLSISDGRGKYEFGLVRYQAEDQSGKHRFVHISDTEIGDVNQGAWVKNLHDYANSEKAAFIVHTGDICYEKGLKSHVQIMNNESLKCPMYYCIGNHDLVKGEYGEQLFESLYGPVFYSFETGNVHYIVTPMLGGDHRPSYKKEDVYRWMKNDLAQVSKEKSIVVFNHDLLTYSDQFIYGINPQEQINLNDHNLKAWIFGHWHINYIRKQGEVMAISTGTADKGGIDHSTSAFRVMHVDKQGNLESELRYSYLDKLCQIASPQNNSLAALNPDNTIPLSVNTYHSPCQTMEVTYRFEQDGKLSKPRALKQNTDWNWSALLSTKGLKTGDQVCVIVESRFRDGTVASDRSSFIYDPRKKEEPVASGNYGSLLGNVNLNGIHPASINPSAIQLSWVKNVGSSIFMAAPLIVDNNVIVASTDEDLLGKGAVVALDLATGKEIWRFSTRNSIKNSIAFNKGNVFAQDAQGYLYAVNAQNGQLAWEKKLAVKELPCLVEGLNADNGIVYAGTGEGLCAMDAASGKELWRNKDWSQAEGTPSTPTLSEGVVVMGAQWGALYANDRSTGKQLWSISKDGMRFRASSPSIYNNKLYVISDKSLFIIEPLTGEVVTRKELPYSVDASSTPLVTDKGIFFGTVYNGLVCLDREMLTEKWNCGTRPNLIYTASYTKENGQTIESSPVLINNTIYFGASDGSIYGVDKDLGVLDWKFNTGAPVFATIAVSGNSFAVVDFSGNVYLFASESSL